ncbi:MAG TPA: hypothetical protein PLT47_04705 [Bacteroidales bacterium]|nr:hypothetical protein [Bacteroidales bacterium]HQI70027.1 hypothetical protein [Bacteroidales bacterium]
MKQKILFLITIVFIASCSQIKEFTNLLTCDFRLSTAENITLGGVNVQKLKSFSDLKLVDGAALLANVASGSLPLHFTLNVEARNPNKEKAALNKLDWIAFIDDTQIAAGTTAKRVEIAPNNGTGIFPIQINTDLVKLLSGQSGKNIVNFGLNLVDAGNRPTRISLKAKPTVMVGNYAVQYPGYITIKKDFGAK